MKIYISHVLTIYKMDEITWKTINLQTTKVILLKQTLSKKNNDLK